MSANNELTRYIVDQLSSVGEIIPGRFFGGISLKCRGRQFAMVMKSSLYFRVNKKTREKYLEYGSTPFSYKTKSKRVFVRSYFEVPADILDDSEQLASWAERAITEAE
ncbi:TfoX/Sxy family protein [Kiloniella laminariae]|uniref:TfoX/Sxy family protein n=1 Tax=Kiloniella laminariae TaxID=454162 RepID=UPI0003701FFF|nr:TfoX/Sxy family protein [Kiloniella laminariae]